MDSYRTVTSVSCTFNLRRIHLTQRGRERGLFIPGLRAEKDGGARGKPCRFGVCSCER